MRRSLGIGLQRTLECYRAWGIQSGSSRELTKCRWGSEGLLAKRVPEWCIEPVPTRVPPRACMRATRTQGSPHQRAMSAPVTTPSWYVCERGGGVLGRGGREKRERIDRRLTIYRKEGEGMLLTEDRHKSIAGPTQAGYL